jgi:hypothetical protein
MRAALNVSRTSYAAATTFATCPDTIRALAVDRAGNAYHVNANEESWIWMTPAGGAGDRYVVAGAGITNGHTELSPVEAPILTELDAPRNLVIGPTGRFMFTSAGDGGAGSYLRQM